MKMRAKEVIGLLIGRWGRFLCRKWMLPRGRVLVFGGHGGTLFDDNSRALGEFATRDPHFACIWIYRSPSIKERVHQAGLEPLHVDSFRAALALEFSEAFFFSHSLNDIVSRPHKFKTHRPVVYMGHGVWGLKRVERRGFGAANSYFTHSICVSDIERSLKSRILDKPLHAILPTGLPKHDRIQSLAKEATTGDTARVLIAPTWRDWLQRHPTQIAVGAFMKGWSRLMEAAPKTAPDGKPIRYSILIHKNAMQLEMELSQLARHHNLEVARPDQDVTRLIVTSDYLVTDYSSLAWDFLTLERPLARYPFDEMIYGMMSGEYDEIASLLSDLSTSDPARVWQILFRPETVDAVKQIRSRAIPFSANGNSCESILGHIVRRT
jgi:hypothetical protein